MFSVASDCADFSDTHPTIAPFDAAPLVEEKGDRPKAVAKDPQEKGMEPAGIMTVCISAARAER